MTGIFQTVLLILMAAKLCGFNAWTLATIAAVSLIIDLLVRN